MTAMRTQSDAVAVDMPPGHLPRVLPNRPAIWVHSDGVWCSGWISAWVHLPDATWLVWCQHVHPGGAVHAVWEWYVHDEATIRRRDGSAPPGERP